MSDAQISLHASVPSIDSILRLDTAAVLVEQYGRSLVTEGVRQVIADIRSQITELGEKALPLLAESAVVAQVARYVEDASAPSLRAVYNLTGTVLHTNLGRAVMAKEAIDAMVKVATGASNLEYDIESGKRGDRDSHLDDLLCKLTGAEAATVVNNNAAAVLLVLNTLGQRKEVPVSRGELIEIGGAFRIPDIMKRAGCKLVEIGTTNRTHLKDYAEAISAKTACLMKVHTSNYTVQGFTKEVTAKEMSELARSRNLPVIEDLGSGTLIDLSKFGLPHEPTAQEAINSGVDVVTFSGDKLLGGPQAGLIVGRKDLIAKIKKNPMKRAMRLDKVTIAALTATLQLYLDPDTVAMRVPTIRLLSRSKEDIQAVAEHIAAPLRQALGEDIYVKQINCQSQIGSGSLPVERLDSIALSIAPQKGKPGGKLKKYAEAFRALPTPVIGRIQDDAFLLDLRCLEDVGGFLAQLDDLKL
ncbi:MAG: L-seryl-tRNA(Sec) selenium transferase [Rhodospirillaceae bacterium]|jgi:L-seryl-tRNA(Ser) seleniumtransferase|nr:L-seryl-tRNA(Sec) selenium transferase [Rhodospirillaceae bacterium]MBT4589205.1 L-seryl-tRNA(Sec) selenium transferase [Rhodospirillaceae bacterium]MBT5941768.1 L-seryl-tRNA(Sec) selenium transferase [Rhodospirillaceae bacterium]MBT7267678.1 L-seryl-tRNA(Sec) selenium transferase [Rhodospirillaceae bacterium]